jgi:hypothetical protein
VPRSLESDEVPAEVEILPMDFTRIPPLPEVMSAFKAVVPEEWIDIGPLVELKDPVPV